MSPNGAKHLSKVPPNNLIRTPFAYKNLRSLIIRLKRFIDSSNVLKKLALKWLFRCSRLYGPGISENIFSRDTFFLIRKGMDDQMKLRVAVALRAVFRARHSWVAEDGPMDMQYAKHLLRNFYFAAHSKLDKQNVA